VANLQNFRIQLFTILLISVWYDLFFFQINNNSLPLNSAFEFLEITQISVWWRSVLWFSWLWHDVNLTIYFRGMYCLHHQGTIYWWWLFYLCMDLWRTCNHFFFCDVHISYVFYLFNTGRSHDSFRSPHHNVRKYTFWLLLQ
jgi:hypothetical protein